MAMSSRGAPKLKHVMTQAINLIYEFLKNRDIVQIWLYENKSVRIEGIIVGFDEYMNLVVDDASELNVKSHTTSMIGKILLKGDCVTLIQRVEK